MNIFNGIKICSIDDVRISNRTVSIKGIELLGSFINFFFSHTQGFKMEHKKRILIHFLKKGELFCQIDNSNPQRYWIRLNEHFNSIEIPDDPVKNESFTVIHQWGSILNLHGHIFKHCIADYWKRADQGPFIMDKDAVFHTEFWKQFKKIGCHYFSRLKLSDIDSPEKAINVFDPHRHKDLDRIIDNIKSTKKKMTIKGLSNLKIISKEFDTKNICQNCLKTHKGVETFLDCWDLFSNHQVHETYLKKIGEWVLRTMQDKDNSEFYKGNKNNGKPQRRHVHYELDGRKIIYSYVVEPENASHIYVMVFKQINMKNQYIILTAFPLGINSNPTHYISENVKFMQRQRSFNIENYCHYSNWSF
jgi:hypothetical protein